MELGAASDTTAVIGGPAPPPGRTTGRPADARRAASSRPPAARSWRARARRRTPAARTTRARPASRIATVITMSRTTKPPRATAYRITGEIRPPMRPTSPFATKFAVTTAMPDRRGPSGIRTDQEGAGRERERGRGERERRDPPDQFALRLRCRHPLPFRTATRRCTRRPTAPRTKPIGMNTCSVPSNRSTRYPRPPHAAIPPTIVPVMAHPVAIPDQDSLRRSLAAMGATV